MDNVEIKNLSEAKKEYTQQLINLLKNDIYNGIKNIYSTVLDKENYLEEFQNRLREIPKWNQDVIDQKYQDFIKNTSCDWLDELLQAVFISNTAILTTVKSKNNVQNKIDLTIPKCSRFIHKCYIETAREIFKNPYLFLNDLDYKTTQKNMRETLDLISISVETSIRNMLPMRDILRQYLKDVEINADKGTDFHLSDETITQKQEPNKDQEIIQQLENAVEEINNNNLDVKNIDEPKFNEEEDDDDEEINHNTLIEKNKLLNDNINRLNDINSESEEEDNEEELIDYMASLNKNVGTETEMKAYENETLIDNNLDTTDKRQINIADLSDKHFEYDNVESPEISDNEDEEKIEPFKTSGFNIPELEPNNQEKIESDNEKIEQPEMNNLISDNIILDNQMISNQNMEESNKNDDVSDDNIDLNNIKNNIYTGTILPPINFLEDENSDEDVNETGIGKYELDLGKYELDLGNIQVNQTLKEASNLINNFNKEEQELNKDMNDMKIDLSNINDVENDIQFLTSEKKEPNQIVINLKKNNSEKRDLIRVLESDSNDENELYQVDLPDDLK
jgi:hypothetical protein